jgi:hypothetical protein
MIKPTSTLTPRQQLDTFIDRYSDEVAAVMRKALQLLRRRVPGATELVYDNYNALGVGFGPSARASEVVLSIVAYPRWVSLFFLQNGARLADPGRLLRGSGTRVRHVVLTTPAVLTSPAVEALIAQALGSAKVAIDPSRRRTVMIKSIAARQRPRRAAQSG